MLYSFEGPLIKLPYHILLISLKLLKTINCKALWVKRQSSETVHPILHLQGALRVS